MEIQDEGRKIEAGTSPALNTEVAPTDEEKKDAGLDCPAQPENPVVAPEPEPEPEQSAPEVPVQAEPEQTPGVTESHALSQEQVNDLVGKTRGETRERTFRYIYDRYGVSDEAGLDALVGDAQRYETLSGQYEADKKAWKDADSQRSSELDELREKVALMQSGIDPARYDDAKYIIKGKGLKVGDDTIAAELASHPEWKKEEPQPKPESRISVLGNEKNDANDSADAEEERAMRMFRV